jgi:hypothetical protein
MMMDGSGMTGNKRSRNARDDMRAGPPPGMLQQYGMQMGANRMMDAQGKNMMNYHMMMGQQQQMGEGGAPPAKKVMYLFAVACSCKSRSLLESAAVFVAVCVLCVCCGAVESDT